MSVTSHYCKFEITGCHKTPQRVHRTEIWCCELWWGV